jgi:hypothetical protein
MSDTSTRLGLPYLAAGQAQKHVTVNESLLRLDAVAQLSAVSASLAAQPAAPDDGAIYILPPGKTGADWGGMANGALAYYRDGAWEELTPQEGWRCFVHDEHALYARTAGAWAKLAASDERRLIFTPGGDGQVSIYRFDSARTQNPRAAIISSIASDVITITTADAGLIFDQARMAGVCYARIWNTSKSPAQSAWVMARPSTTTLQVLDGAAIASWSNGETIQLGDPTDITPNRFVALDISPMLQNVLGRVFPQKGILARIAIQGSGGTQATLALSPTGITGAGAPTRSESSGGMLNGNVIIPSSAPSPVSNSNLVFVQETGTSTNLGTANILVAGVWA